MGRRTGKDPSVEDSFLWRVCHALDQPPRMLANNIGVEYGDLEELLGERGSVDNPVYVALMDYINEQLGAFLAVKIEINKMLQKDNTKRLTRLEEMTK